MNPIPASSLGFSPEASGLENASALQAALDQGGSVTVDWPGTYDLAGPMQYGIHVCTFSAPAIEKIQLKTRRVTGSAITGTLILKGVHCREKFLISPARWKENGGGADYHVPEAALSDLQTLIKERLGQDGVAVASVHMDVPPRFHWKE